MVWVIRTADNAFLRDKGGEGVLPSETVVTIQGVPDARLERYDATTPTGRRLATAQEIAAYDAGVKDATSAQLSEEVLVRALARATWEELQKMQPKAGQAPLDLQGFRDRVKALIRQIVN